MEKLPNLQHASARLPVDREVWEEEGHARPTARKSWAGCEFCDCSSSERGAAWPGEHPACNNETELQLRRRWTYTTAENVSSSEPRASPTSLAALGWTSILASHDVQALLPLTHVPTSFFFHCGAPAWHQWSFFCTELGASSLSERGPKRIRKRTHETFPSLSICRDSLVLNTNNGSRSCDSSKLSVINCKRSQLELCLQRANQPNQ